MVLYVELHLLRKILGPSCTFILTAPIEAGEKDVTCTVNKYVLCCQREETSVLGVQAILWRELEKCSTNSIF